MESREYKTKRMLEHLEEKYGEKFELVTAGSGTYMDSFFALTAIPESNQDFGVTAKYFDKGYDNDRNENGTKECIEDDYMSYLMHEELEIELSEVLEGIFEEYKVYKASTSMTMSDEIRPGYTAREYMQTPYNFASFVIVTSKSIEEREADLEKIHEVLKENKFIIKFQLVYIQKEAFEGLGEDDYNTTLVPKEGVTKALISCYIEKDFTMTDTGWRFDK